MTRRSHRERGNLVRRYLVVILTIGATVAITGALRQPEAATPRPPGPSLGTPLWSVRRTPQPVADAVGAQHLQTALTAATGGNRACWISAVRTRRATKATAMSATELRAHRVSQRIDQRVVLFRMVQK